MENSSVNEIVKNYNYTMIDNEHEVFKKFLNMNCIEFLSFSQFMCNLIKRIVNRIGSGQKRDHIISNIGLCKACIKEVRMLMTATDNFKNGVNFEDLRYIGELVDNMNTLFTMVDIPLVINVTVNNGLMFSIKRC